MMRGAEAADEEDDALWMQYSGSRKHGFGRPCQKTLSQPELALQNQPLHGSE